MNDTDSRQCVSILTKKWFLSVLVATSLGAATLLVTTPAGAQTIYLTGGGQISPYSPISAAMEPPGCPLNGSGQWASINNDWIWCPPTIGYGYNSQVGYGSPVGYGYGSPVGYGYGSPVGYGYGSQVGYGYGSPPVGYATLTGSPVADMLLGLTVSSLTSSQFQPYGQQAYYPGYSFYGQGYPGYGQTYPVGYQSYPGYSGGNTYIRNIYRKTIYRNNELRWLARDRKSIAVLRAQGANRAEIAHLKHRIEFNQDRIAKENATERGERSRVAVRQDMRHDRIMSRSHSDVKGPQAAKVHVVTPRAVTPHTVAFHMTAPHRDTARMSAPRRDGAAGRHHGRTMHHRRP